MSPAKTKYFQTLRRRDLFAIFVIALLLSASNLTLGQDGNNETDDAVVIFNQAQEAHEKGDLLGAIKLYEKAIEIIPEFPEAELQRGSAYLSLGKIDAAETAFRKAAELREDWTLALANLGVVLVRKNQFAEAETVLKKAIELDDLNFPAFVAMTDLRLKTRAKPEVLRELLARIRVLSSKAKPTAAIIASQGALENALGDLPSAK
ncbi:MAG TPA: tetratricopeptide repeat protein, partial [Pyrinomonadaceae bacterium]|nr:tetratricopeptide repeat protein [Pyrinomonadaceae bacterium]